ncbi:hypothetical protein [Ralstonia pseudosolanacearum]|uniref:hypothetical protein n=1 Tax=Ralstonia pseudosolanacearum TaxID=1310165 RepID=UPI003CEC9BF5
MDVLRLQVIQQFEKGGGKVVVIDKGASMVPIIHAMRVARAERQLARMRRHGSRKVKVAVRRVERRHRRLGYVLTEAVAEVRAILRK